MRLQALTRRLSVHAQLGMEQLNEQIVAGHLAPQVFAVQVFFGEGAERAQLGQAEQQVSKASEDVRGGAQRVLQQGSFSLLLHALYEPMVLQLLHIWSVGGRGKREPMNLCTATVVKHHRERNGEVTHLERFI